ncbi:methionine gamma-lyase [Bacillus lacus]|uniref:L-methionine gamma-lyase n=1 Tax=Metabacillus lacus TaxID=1983721 RepID=A0A7X2J0Z6_9BACI|nr:methionine gamma-lyase [Metabacillus lacus]MRX72748.1 methionine gamma-lyase [Metabacillus lacus]
MEKDLHFETKLIHSSEKHEDPYRSLVPPLYQTSTFAFENAAQGEARFSGADEGPVYTRLSNPTVEMLEKKLANLEGGEAALAFSSGMGAVSSVLLSLVNQNQHILCSKGVYGCTYGLLQMLKEKFAISHTFSGMNSSMEIESAILPETACIYIETPINPTMELIDLELAAKIGKKHGIPVIVDNTFCSPYLQQPLLLNCDIVIHSATKYISGHGDVIAGIAVGKIDYLNEVAMTVRKDIGSVLSPFDAWLLLRGLKTLAVRMDRHCETAEKLAVKLENHPVISSVSYPFLRSFPQYDLAVKQMKKGGGLITITVKGGKEEAQKVMDALKLVKIAVSLGDAETLIQHPATMTHSVIDEKERIKMGITDNMLRLSVGLEAEEDIWEDLSRALRSI